MKCMTFVLSYFMIITPVKRDCHGSKESLFVPFTISFTERRDTLQKFMSESGFYDTVIISFVLSTIIKIYHKLLHSIISFVRYFCCI